jgi:hypothetical protein
MDAMYFLDDDDDLEQMREMRQHSQPLEQEHLELRIALRDAEAALNAAPSDQQWQARVTGLRQKLEELNRKAPWISAEQPIEMSLFGTPHG